MSKETLEKFVNRKWESMTDDLFEEVAIFADENGYSQEQAARVLDRQGGAVGDDYNDWAESE